MKKLRWLRILGAIVAAIGLIGIGASSLASSAMIVAIGIRGVEAFKVAGIITAAVGGLAIAGGTVPVVTGLIDSQNRRRELESHREKSRKSFDEYAKDSLNPERTRERFEQLKLNNPHLTKLVDICLSQMDRMDTCQARQQSLLTANEAIYLEDTVTVINESERRMCRNFRNIINCCILIEDTDQGSEQLDGDIINSSLADNEEELKSVSTLLKYSVAYINNYNRNGVSDRSELDAWLKIMKSSTSGDNAKGGKL